MATIGVFAVWRNFQILLGPDWRPKPPQEARCTGEHIARRAGHLRSDHLQPVVCGQTHCQLEPTHGTGGSQRVKLRPFPSKPSRTRAAAFHQAGSARPVKVVWTRAAPKRNSALRRQVYAPQR